MTEPRTAQTPQSRLIELLTPMVADLGYELVHLEVQTQRQKILRLFIDRVPAGSGTIGVEDCVRVSKALDEPLDQLPELESIFHGQYELEVSSPGVDRPLRLAKDYERFSGKQARIHVFRPLTAEELGDGEYHRKNPKQKNFIGVLKGLRNERVLLILKQEKPQAAESGTVVSIPLSLISKANLEPVFEFED